MHADCCPLARPRAFVFFFFRTALCLVFFLYSQGLELVNPNADAEKKVKEANKKWFDSSSGFMSAKPK